MPYSALHKYSPPHELFHTLLEPGTELGLLCIYTNASHCKDIEYGITVVLFSVHSLC